MQTEGDTLGGAGAASATTDADAVAAAATAAALLVLVHVVHRPLILLLPVIFTGPHEARTTPQYIQNKLGSLLTDNHREAIPL